MTGILLGKLALITGGGSGIGRAIANHMVRQGAEVIVADKDLNAAQKTLSELNAASSAYELDVSSMDSIISTLNETLKEYKRPPSVIVNAAGITRDAYLLKMTEIEFDEVYKTNMKGTFMVTQQFANSMVSYKVNGSIVNISSISSELCLIGQSNYAASKSAVAAFTKVASKELGKFNIRVNAVLPGFIDTPMTQRVPDVAKERAINNCILKRLGTPDEVAEVVSFLASEKSSYINGALIEVTGGLLS